MSPLQCDISQIPAHLLLQIINNLSDDSLLRFLLTCRSAETFIRECFPRIRKRPLLHKKLFLEGKPRIGTIVDKSSLPPSILLEMEMEINRKRWFLNPYPAFSNPLFFQWMMVLNHQRFRAPDWIPRKLDYSDCTFELEGKKYRFNGAELPRLTTLALQITDLSAAKEVVLEFLKFSPFYPAHIALVDKDASLLFLQSTSASRQKFATCEVGTADLEVLQALKLRKFDKINSY